MLNNILKFIFLLLCINGLNADAEIEWEKVPGAVSYRLEIKDIHDKTVFSEKTSGTVIKVRLDKGEFFRRVVSIDKTGDEFPSEWTPIHLISQKEKRNRIRLEWEKNSKADYYIAEVQDLAGRTLVRRTVRKTETELELPLGKYRKRILTVDRTGESIASAWTDLEIIQDEKRSLPFDIIIRSAAFPGWGQLYSASTYGAAQNRLRGYSIMTLSAFLTGAYIFYAGQAETEKRKFSRYANNAILFSAASGDSTYYVQDIYNVYIIQQMNQMERSYSLAGNTANTALGLLGAVYILQLADAFRIQKSVFPNLSFQIGRIPGRGTETVYSLAAQFEFQ